MDPEPFDMNCLHPELQLKPGAVTLPTMVANQGPSEQFFCLPGLTISIHIQLIRRVHSRLG